MSTEHFKFHKVVQRHYSGEVENVYIILQQKYSGNGVPNFIRIAGVLLEILQKTFWSLVFLDTVYKTVSSTYCREDYIQCL